MLIRWKKINDVLSLELRFSFDEVLLSALSFFANQLHKSKIYYFMYMYTHTDNDDDDDTAESGV